MPALPSLGVTWAQLAASACSRRRPAIPENNRSVSTPAAQTAALIVFCELQLRALARTVKWAAYSTILLLFPVATPRATSPIKWCYQLPRVSTYRRALLVSRARSIGRKGAV